MSTRRRRHQRGDRYTCRDAESDHGGGCLGRCGYEKAACSAKQERAVDKRSEAGGASCKVAPRAKEQRLDRRLGGAESRRDLGVGEALPFSEEQCVSLCRRKLRMAADEHQPQDIVAIMRAVEPLGECALGIFEI